MWWCYVYTAEGLDDPSICENLQEAPGYYRHCYDSVKGQKFFIVNITGIILLLLSLVIPLFLRIKLRFKNYTIKTILAVIGASLLFLGVAHMFNSFFFIPSIMSKVISLTLFFIWVFSIAIVPFIFAKHYWSMTKSRRNMLVALILSTILMFVYMNIVLIILNFIPQFKIEGMAVVIPLFYAIFSGIILLINVVVSLVKLKN